MATLNSAVQLMVDNLHSKMTSNAPLSPEEQALIATAIDKLTDQSNWEQALIAVAEQHLNTATSALTSVQTDINSAKDTLQTQNANLDLIPKIDSNFNGVSKPIFGVRPIEENGTTDAYRRSPSIFAVYDANGDTFAVRPSRHIKTASDHDNRLEYIKIHHTGVSVDVLKSHYVQEEIFYENPTSYIFLRGLTAILPLASKENPNDIAYETVYTSQTKASNLAEDFAGVYCASSGYSSVTKPKKNMNAHDKWGIPTVTDHGYFNFGPLYDNNKHCLLLVDDATSMLIEKYRDGNVSTGITVSNDQELQNYVSAGDFTTVRFIGLYLPWLNCYRRDNANASNNSISHYIDCYTYFGKIHGIVGMGGHYLSAHYRFTEDKKLEPLNYFASSSASMHKSISSDGTVNAVGDVNVALTDQQNNTLGLYHFQSKADSQGESAGYMISAVMCMNPYSNVGLLNEVFSYSSGVIQYGIGRTCRAF